MVVTGGQEGVAPVTRDLCWAVCCFAVGRSLLIAAVDPDEF